jgi:hypothetical protein
LLLILAHRIQTSGHEKEQENKKSSVHVDINSRCLIPLRRKTQSSKVLIAAANTFVALILEVTLALATCDKEHNANLPEAVVEERELMLARARALDIKAFPQHRPNNVG